MIVVGAAVRVHAGGKDGRPGVVLRLLPDNRAFVLYGTGTARPELAHVLVHPRTAPGTTLRLEKETYFYRGNSTVCMVDKLELLGVTCPPSLMIALRKLVGL